jgi:hypothetical protein
MGNGDLFERGWEALGSEESRRDKKDDYCNKVERRWEDVTVIEGRLVAGEGALKGRNECCKVGRGRRSCNGNCS